MFVIININMTGKWLDVCSCPGINNITTSHLICLLITPECRRKGIRIR